MGMTMSPAGMVEAGRHRRRLAEVTAQLDQLERVVRVGEPHEPLDRCRRGFRRRRR